jgi:hypothetical protein
VPDKRPLGDVDQLPQTLEMFPSDFDVSEQTRERPRRQRKIPIIWLTMCNIKRNKRMKRMSRNTHNTRPSFVHILATVHHQEKENDTAESYVRYVGC